MAVPVQCDQCEAKYLIEDRFAGKRAKCKRCGHIMSIPLPAGPGGSPGLSSDDTGGTGEIGMEDVPFAAPGARRSGGGSVEGVTSQPPRGWRPQDIVVERDEDITDIPLAAGSRPYVAAQPTGRTFDALVPILLLVYAALVIYLGWAGQTKVESEHPAEVIAAAGGWIKAYIWGQAGFMLVGLFAIAGPLILAGVAIGLKLRKLSLPASAYLRACALAAIPGSLIAFAMLEKAKGTESGLFAVAVLVALVGGFFALRFIMGLDWVGAGVCYAFAAFLGVIGTTISVNASAGAARAMFESSVKREVARVNASASRARSGARTSAIGLPQPPSAVPSPSPEPGPAPTPVAPTPTPDPAQPSPSPVPVPLPTPPNKPEPVATGSRLFPNEPGDGLGEPTTPTVETPTPVPLEPTRLTKNPDAEERDTLVETAVDDMKTRVVAAGGTAVTGVEGLPLKPDVIGIIHAPGPSNAFAVLRRSAGAALREDILDIYNGNPSAKVATANFTLEGAAAQSSYALSADGQRLARIAQFPKLSVRVTTVPDNKDVSAVELDSKNGRPTLLGFLNADRLLVRWESQGQFGIEVQDLRTRKHGRQSVLADFDPSPASSALSPDGRQFAYVSRTPGKNVVTVVPLFEGRSRQLTVNSLDPKLGVRPAGLAFSPDGTKLSALFIHAGAALVTSWNVRTGATLPDATISVAVQSLEALPSATPAAAGVPNSLSYVGNGALLVGGTLLISAADARPLVELGMTSAFAQMVAGDSAVFVACRDGATPVGLLTVAFDPKLTPGTPGRGGPAAAAAGSRPAPAAGTPAPRAPTAR
jgi:hypothetical protein